MRLISFVRPDGVASIGLMVDQTSFIDACRVDPKIPRAMVDVLKDPIALARLRAVASTGKIDATLSDVHLLPVIPEPHAIWALALNFKTHLEETGLTTNPNFPHVFLRVAAAHVGHLQPLLCPPAEIDRAFDYEGELAVIIGRGGRHIPAEKALEHVAGYACYNEGSVRAYQSHNRQFGVGKNFEASGSFGPWMMTADEFGDPKHQRVRTTINGLTRQDAPLNDMLFSVQDIIAYLSTGYSLRTGDVIVAGTPGTLPQRAGDIEGGIENQFGPIQYAGMVHMKPGDVVEVEVTGLGVLKNTVVADQARVYRPA